MFKKFLAYFISCFGLITPHTKPHTTVIDKYETLTDEEWRHLLLPQVYNSVRQFASTKNRAAKVIVITYQGPISLSESDLHQIKKNYSDADFIVLNIL